MSWQATLTINNNTNYNITVTHNTVGDIGTVNRVLVGQIQLVM